MCIQEIEVHAQILIVILGLVSTFNSLGLSSIFNIVERTRMTIY